MKLKITIEMDNAAFEDAPATEAARILRGLANDIEDGVIVGDNYRLGDINGNKVGAATVEE
jgi:hypothetical protein